MGGQAAKSPINRRITVFACALCFFLRVQCSFARSRNFLFKPNLPPASSHDARPAQPISGQNRHKWRLHIDGDTPNTVGGLAKAFRIVLPSKTQDLPFPDQNRPFGAFLLSLWGRLLLSPLGTTKSHNGNRAKTKINGHDDKLPEQYLACAETWRRPCNPLARWRANAHPSQSFLQCSRARPAGYVCAPLHFWRQI